MKENRRCRRRHYRPVMAGERDPDKLATYPYPHCKASAETIRAALVGNDREEHVFDLAQALELHGRDRVATKSPGAKGRAGGNGSGRIRLRPSTEAAPACTCGQARSAVRTSSDTPPHSHLGFIV